LKRSTVALANLQALLHAIVVVKSMERHKISLFFALIGVGA
jgi:hypothetical protein